MGSCISKCRPKKKFKEDCSHVHDKLVISQDPPISSLPKVMTTMPLEKPVSPAPSTSSTASFSSFSCSTNSKCSTMASSISSSSSLSSSSCSSSVLCVKDRSFSNEFLWSCLKDNPHIVGLKEKTLERTVLSDNKIHSHNHDQSLSVSSPNIAPKFKQSAREKVMVSASTPKKRARASSPTLVRQKSFRKEHNAITSTPNRALRSPSPSRRFNGENARSFSTNVAYENSYKRPIMSKGNAVSSATSDLRREGFRAPIASPNRDFLARKKNAVSQQISTKNGGHVGVGEIKSNQEMDVVMEDINNPLIALDCFIFL